eukprot:scaffold18738_cov25-Prasinocladus_malaysianus.AAC.1
MPQCWMVNDRQKGLIAAGDLELPNTAKGMCCKHLVDNARQPRNAGAQGWTTSDFWALQEASTAAAFQQKLELLRAKNPNAAKYFDGIPHEHWTKYKTLELSIKTYGLRCSNHVESENARLVPARNAAPLGSLNHMAIQMASEANAARVRANKMIADRHFLVDYARAQLKLEENLARTCTVQQLSACTGLVKQCNGRNTVDRTVDFSTLSCTCGDWQATGRPCRHAIAFAPLYFGPTFKTIPITWYKMGWDDIYHSENYHLCVKDGAVHVPNMEALMPDGTTEAPQWIQASGRPTKIRKRSAADANGLSKRTGRPLKVHKCSRCNQPGHHFSTCNLPPMIIDLT